MKYMRIITIFLACIGHLLIGDTSLDRTFIEHPIVVVVCSYNNEKWSENTLNSIFSQDYTNFRLIIVDDCSTDNNVAVIQKFIDDNNLADRVTFIKNTVRHRKLFNLYSVLYDCHDDEIVFMVDGDDSIFGTDVFAHINSLYQNEDIWFTYGQYRNVPASQAILYGHKEMGYCRPVPKHIQRKHAYRYYSFIYMHPRTFRAWLFKLVRLEDLIADTIEGFRGNFYPASNDVAMYFPMVEMAHTHIKFIPDILYIRNLYSDLVGFKVDRKIQTASAREIRKKGCYPILFKPQTNRLAQVENALTDVFLLCRYNLTDIENNLKNIQKKASHIESIYVFFQNTPDNKKTCRTIKKDFPNVVFIPYDNEGAKDLKNRLLGQLSVLKNDYIFVTTDTCSLLEDIHFPDYIFWLEKTFAYRFYLNRQAGSPTTPHFIPLTDTVCAWKMHPGLDAWKGIIAGEDVFICRKLTLYQEIKRAHFNNIYGFFKEITTSATLPIRVGLFTRNAVVKIMT